MSVHFMIVAERLVKLRMIHKEIDKATAHECQLRVLY